MHCQIPLFFAYFPFPGKGLSREKTLAMIMLLANETKAYTAFLCLLSFPTTRRLGQPQLRFVSAAPGKRVERGKNACDDHAFGQRDKSPYRFSLLTFFSREKG